MDIWDERKELLYNDVRKVFDAYPSAQPTSSWYKSGKALRELTDLDHKGLFEAKAHYKNNVPATVSTEAIDVNIREVIGNEYENMKGIEKYGRSNGRCPSPGRGSAEVIQVLSEELTS